MDVFTKICTVSILLFQFSITTAIAQQQPEAKDRHWSFECTFCDIVIGVPAFLFYAISTDIQSRPDEIKRERNIRKRRRLIAPLAKHYCDNAGKVTPQMADTYNQRLEIAANDYNIPSKMAVEYFQLARQEFHSMAYELCQKKYDEEGEYWEPLGNRPYHSWWKGGPIYPKNADGTEDKRSHPVGYSCKTESGQVYTFDLIDGACELARRYPRNAARIKFN